MRKYLTALSSAVFFCLLAASAARGQARVAAAGDFNGDGIGDLVCQTQWGSVNNLLLGWTGTNSPATGYQDVFRGTTTWLVLGAGDIDSNGVPDLAWQLPTGQATCWFMDSNGVRKASASICANPTQWRIRGAGDIDRDGIADLVWQNPSGQVVCWFMKTNAALKSSVAVSWAPSPWLVRAVGDIDKDGIADLVWQLPAGQVACWFMNADGTRKSSTNIYSGATVWQVRAAGDLDGDGTADLVWQLPAGGMTGWILNANGSIKRGFPFPNGRVGMNLPWIGYGHDFNSNGWGYDALVVSGWTYQTYPDSRGFTDIRRVAGQGRNGSACLAITADYTNGRKKGEAYVSLASHPIVPGITSADLRNSTVSCWVWFPTGSAGPRHAPNGFQFLFKSGSTNWYSWYGQWINIQRSWENRWVQFSVRLSDAPAYMNYGFDASKAIALGVKFGINSSSSAAFQGTLLLDDYAIRGGPTPTTFDFERLEIEQDFANLKYSSDVARFFALCDGRASPVFDAGGTPTGLGSRFFENFDALLLAARRNNIRLVPVLLDFNWFDNASYDSGVRLGGHSDVIRDAAKRQAFVNNVLIPLVQRYSNSTEILAWDVINEPEWRVTEIHPGEGDPVTLAEMRDFIKLCVDTIHARSSQKVTVGSASRQWLANWTGLGLDLYQFHWYDKFEDDGEVFPWLPCSDLGLDKPCFIGEAPLYGSAHSPEEYEKAAADGGYSDVLFWSYRAGSGM